MGFFQKIKETFVGKSTKQNEKYVAGLDKSSASFSSKINALAARYREINDEYFDELENILIMSDVGVNMVMKIVDEIKKEVRLEISRILMRLMILSLIRCLSSMLMIHI